MTLAKTALALGSAVGAQQLARTVQNLGVNDVLATIGLQRRRSAIEKILPAVGWIGLGTVLGAGAALLLAPSSGRELRARVSGQLEQAKSRVDQQIHAMEEAVRSNGN